MTHTSQLRLQIADDDLDAEQLSGLAEELRAALAEQGLTATEDRPGSRDDLAAQRAIDPVIGVIVIALANSKVLIATVKAIEAWLSRKDSGPTVTANLDGEVEVTITGDSSAMEQRRINILVDNYESKYK
jgi:Effector Associated Constant Component 1